jgi:hypothetical protein
MFKFCLICTPRSGSFYVQRYISKTFGLEFGSEWFGRVKKIHYEFGLKSSAVDIDHSVNENLLTNAEITKRLVYLKNYNPSFIIKCMPFQLTNTIERNNISFDGSQEISSKIMRNFSLIYLENRDILSQFCFDVISKKQNYIKRNFTSYNPDIRQMPLENSMTATEEHFEHFLSRQKYVEVFKERNYNGQPIIIWEDFVNDPIKEMYQIEEYYGIRGMYYEKNKRDIIPHPDYSKIFTNYDEIKSWIG